MNDHEIDTILNEIPRLKNRHGFETAEFLPIENGMKALSERRHDSCFYLGIVGEYTVGKSTLINALLGFEAVKEDILQATTCTPTILRHSETFGVSVELNNGQVLKYDGPGNGTRFDDIAKFLSCLRNARTFIYTWTADESHACKATKVTVFIPFGNSLFDQNIAIVDTPGLNADNPRHYSVTESAVRDICDAAVVLTDARNPCSASLLQFLKDHLVDMTENCFAVASHIDMVRPRDRDRVAAFVRKRFSSEGMDFASYYALAPFYAAHQDDAENPEAAGFRREFADSFNGIAASLKSLRQRAIKSKLESLIRDLLRDFVNPLIVAKTNALESERKTLAENPLCDFNEFISALRSELKQSVEASFEGCDSGIRSRVSEVANAMEEELGNLIGNASSKEEVQALLNPEFLKQGAGAYYDDHVLPCLKSIREECGKMFEQLSQGVRNTFNQLYGDLARGMESSGRNEIATTACGTYTMPSEIESAGVSILPDEDTQKGVAATGAVIGALVGGPVGAIVGGFIGWMCSGLFGPSLATVKGQAISQVHDIVKAWRTAAGNAASADVGRSKSNVQSALTGLVDSYKKYKADVQALVNLHNRREQELAREIESLQSDLAKFKAF